MRGAYSATGQESKICSTTDPFSTELGSAARPSERSTSAMLVWTEVFGFCAARLRPSSMLRLHERLLISPHSQELMMRVRECQPASTRRCCSH